MANNNTESEKKIKKGSLADLEQRRKNSDRKSIVPQKRKNLKRAIAVVFVVFAVLLLLCFVLERVDSSLKGDGAGPSGYGELNFNSEGILSVDYYEPDYDADIFSEKDYLAENRSIRYIDGNISIVLDEYEDTELDAGQRFFKSYFYAVNHGDYESYREMIADDYDGNPKVYGKNPKTKKFPMQRIYDVTVKKLVVSEDKNNVYEGKQAVFGVYEVCYCIKKNDGEFRLGLPSDKVVPVIYQTATTDIGTENEKTVLTKAYLYDDISENKEGNEAE